MKKLMMAVAAVCAAVLAQAAVTSYDYVHNGLVGYWDGRENVGRGQHSDNLTEWVDLIHGFRIVLYNTTAEADRVVFAGNKDSYGLLDANATLSTFGTAVGEDGRCTVEFVYKANSGAIMLVQAPATSAIMIGQLGNAICFSQGSFDLMDYPTSVQSLTNTITALYSNSKVLKPYWLNATETGVNGSNYFNGDGSATSLIGKRSSNGICLNGSIYAIRVYNRLLSPSSASSSTSSPSSRPSRKSSISRIRRTTATFRRRSPTSSTRARAAIRRRSGSSGAARRRSSRRRRSLTRLRRIRRSSRAC